MGVDGINGVQHGLRVLLVVLHLVPVRHVADRDRDAQVRELLLRGKHLLSELAGTDGAVEEWLRTELNDTRDELGLWVGVERLEQAVASVLPLSASLETELPWRVRDRTYTAARRRGAHPDEGVYAQSVVPSGVDDVVAEW